VIGVDVSEKIVELANSIAEDEGVCHKQRFFPGSATELRHVLGTHYSQIPILPGLAGLKEPFDIAVAIFLFNYLSTQDTSKCMKQVYSLLKPGGHFIFSVPHPMMAFLHKDPSAQAQSESESERPTFSFEKVSNASSGKQHYFSLRDMELKGIIKTIEGVPLNVRMRFKTLNDYFSMLKEIGFRIVEVRKNFVLPIYLFKHDRNRHIVCK
jgi:SAM-dependent methyltransferase